MTLESGKEMDKRCVLNWLNEVYAAPSRAFDKYTEDELKMFAHDTLVLLMENNGGQTKCPKETFWDSLSEVDLMEPMHHFED